MRTKLQQLLADAWMESYRLEKESEGKEKELYYEINMKINHIEVEINNLRKMSGTLK
jgi:hypothetical protein